MDYKPTLHLKTDRFTAQNRLIKQLRLFRSARRTWWNIKKANPHICQGRRSYSLIAMAEGRRRENKTILCLSLARKQCIGISCLPNLASSHFFISLVASSSFTPPKPAVITLLAFSRDSSTNYSTRPWNTSSSSNAHFRKKALSGRDSCHRRHDRISLPARTCAYVSSWWNIPCVLHANLRIGTGIAHWSRA